MVSCNILYNDAIMVLQIHKIKICTQILCVQLERNTLDPPQENNPEVQKLLVWSRAMSHFYYLGLYSSAKVCKINN